MYSSILKQNNQNFTMMSNEHQNNNSIHDFDFNLICTYFSSLHRQGPGSDETTLQALKHIPTLPAGATVADLGCGTGTQTLCLARHTQVLITGLDLFPQFIDLLNQRSQEEGLSHRLTGIVGDMGQLPFAQESLDLIWSEGAIYNIGFNRGILAWKPFLKSGGWLAVSEATWLTDHRPVEIEQFWQDAYPEIDTVEHKLKQLEEAGYQHISHFTLPESCWTDSFYLPQHEAQCLFLERYPNNATAQMLVKNQRHEAELYQQYHAFYGYTFFVAQRP